MRQTSEFGCSDGKWSIYYIRIVNLETASVQLKNTGDACKGNYMDLEFVVTGVDKTLISSWSVDVTDNYARKFTVDYSVFATPPNYIYKLETTTSPANVYTFSLSNFKILLKNSAVPIVKPANV